MDVHVATTKAFSRMLRRAEVGGILDELREVARQTPQDPTRQARASGRHGDRWYELDERARSDSGSRATSRS